MGGVKRIPTMGSEKSTESREELLRGQAEVWQLIHSFADSMALKCAVELRLADIINSHGSALSSSQIASEIDSPCPDVPYLARIMRMLARKGVFSAHHPPDGGEEILYGVNSVSRWLLNDADLSLAPLVLMENHPWQQAPWHYLSHSVKDGGIAFRKAHGCEMWDFALQNPKFNKLFNDALACTAKIIMRAFVEEYRDGLDGIRVLVDVGGGTGSNLAEIVKGFPEIKGINFDLPHVVATAPTYHGISHVGGNMFESIPKADAVFMKWIMHDWGDQYCVEILKNCRRAIPEKTGKLILVEIVLQPGGGNKLFGNMDVVFDMLMFAHTTGGKERTEEEWKKLLEEGGFHRYKIIKLPAITSIIEAHPE